MAKAFSLQPLVHLAQQKHDAATRKLGQLNQHHQAARGKLDMLQQYRKDYQEKLNNAEKDGMALQELRNFKDFITRLDDAIAQQNALVTQTQLSVERGRSELSDTQRRMKSFDTLAKRHVEAEKKIESKLEQKMQDEHSGRHSAYKSIEQGEDN